MQVPHELTRSTWTLTDFVATRPRVQRIALGIGLSVLFAGLTVVGANIVIPMTPVPITLQTLFVLLAGAAIGRGWGTLSQALYVGAGAAGLPVFAGGASGMAIFAGPTGGYLLSFLVAPFVVDAILSSSPDLRRQAAAFFAGTVTIFAMGVSYLALTYTHDVSQAITVGLVPFLPGAVFKILAALSIHRSSQALVRHRGASRG